MDTSLAPAQKSKVTYTRFVICRDRNPPQSGSLILWWKSDRPRPTIRHRILQSHRFRLVRAKVETNFLSGLQDYCEGKASEWTRLRTQYAESMLVSAYPQCLNLNYAARFSKALIPRTA